MPRRGERQGISIVMGYESVVPDLVRRLMMVLVLIALVTLVLWLDRAALRDSAHPERPLELPDVVYFAVVTITTVGYGDIVPVTPRARLISTFLVTPMRIVVLILFFGTAYELVFQRYREAYRMRRLKGRLANHTIVCGYGVKGHATVEELLCFGHSPDEIVVIDASADAARDAARLGVAALRGDATKEATLEAAVIEKAIDIVVDVDRDDTTVLICLTAKHLNPEICVVAAPVSGGRMLAIATHLTHAPRFVDDILSFGRGLGFGEYRLGHADAGRTASEIPVLSGKLVLGAYHGGRTVTYERLPGLRLQEGDVVIYLQAKPESAHEG